MVLHMHEALGLLFNELISHLIWGDNCDVCRQAGERAFREQCLRYLFTMHLHLPIYLDYLYFMMTREDTLAHV